MSWRTKAVERARLDSGPVRSAFEPKINAGGNGSQNCADLGFRVFVRTCGAGALIGMSVMSHRGTSNEESSILRGLLREGIGIKD